MEFEKVTRAGQLSPATYNNWLRHIKTWGMNELWTIEEAKEGRPVRLDQQDVFMDWCRVYKLDEELQHLARTNVLQRYSSLSLGQYNRQQFAYNGFRQSFQDHVVCDYCHLILCKTDDRLWKRSIQDLHLKLSEACLFAQKIAGMLDISAMANPSIK